MPSFDENNLTPEELRGGFDAESSDNDAFSLDDKKEYPGSMPDLSGEETPQEKDEDSAGGGSVWDLFESEQSDEIKDVDEFNRPDDTDSGTSENETEMEEDLEENNEQETAEESALTEDDLMDISGEAVAEEEFQEEQFDEEQPDFQSEAFSEEPPTEEMQDFPEEPVPDDGELPDDLPTFDDIGEKGGIITDDVENAEDNATFDSDREDDEDDDVEGEETIEIDEDLRNLIEEEIERGKTRRIKQEEALKKGPIDLPSLEEINRTEDESGMTSYRPGGISEPQPILVTEAIAVETKDKEKKKKDLPKPPKTEKPPIIKKVKPAKEKKQRGLLPWYYLGLSAAMFAFTAIGFGSYYYGLDKMLIKNAHHVADIIFKPDSTFSVRSKASLANKHSQKPSVDTNNDETPVKEPEANISTEPKRHNEKKDNNRHNSKDLVSNTKQHKPSSALHEKESQGNVTPVIEEEGEYTVQVYSTLSREDAEEWYGKLLSKSVQSPFITRQVIRDKTWYRVRFGKFSTREEAYKAAVRCGFAQSWIDRVK